LKTSQEVVTPLKNGVQAFLNTSRTLDSGFRRNDEKGVSRASYKSIMITF